MLENLILLIIAANRKVFLIENLTLAVWYTNECLNKAGLKCLDITNFSYSEPLPVVRGLDEAIEAMLRIKWISMTDDCYKLSANISIITTGSAHDVIVERAVETSRDKMLEQYQTVRKHMMLESV